MENNERRNNYCSISYVCPNNYNCKYCNLNDYTPDSEEHEKTILTAAVSCNKTLDELRVFGILNLISNRYVLCLDGFAIGASEEDSTFHLDLDNEKYYCNADPSISLSKEEIYSSVVSLICPSNTQKNTTVIYIIPPTKSKEETNMNNNERNNHCPISVVCPNNYNCKSCGLNDYTPDNEKDKTILTAAVNHDKTYHEWFDLVGLCDVMPNGHDIYLDCEELDCAEDSLLHYDINSHTYRCETTDNKEYYITKEEIDKSKVTYIGSSTDDMSVASIWIKPTDEWFKNYPELSGEGLL